MSCWMSGGSERFTIKRGKLLFACLAVQTHFGGNIPAGCATLAETLQVFHWNWEGTQASEYCARSGLLQLTPCDWNCSCAEADRSTRELFEVLAPYVSRGCKVHVTVDGEKQEWVFNGKTVKVNIL